MKDTPDLSLENMNKPHANTCGSAAVTSVIRGRASAGSRSALAEEMHHLHHLSVLSLRE